VYGDFCGLFFEQKKRTSSLTHIFCSRKDLLFAIAKDSTIPNSYIV
jgi:hypothetical protein